MREILHCRAGDGLCNRLDARVPSGCLNLKYKCVWFNSKFCCKIKTSVTRTLEKLSFSKITVACSSPFPLAGRTGFVMRAFSLTECAQPKIYSGSLSEPESGCGLPPSYIFFGACSLIKSDIKRDTQRLWWTSEPTSVALACKYAQSKSHERARLPLSSYTVFIFITLAAWIFLHCRKSDCIRTKER